MSFTDYLEGKLLDHAFRNVSFTSPSTLYLGVFTVAPGEATSGTEVSGGSYARQIVSFSRASNVVSNSGAITFPTATADWGTVVAGGVFDAASGGNLLAKGSLTASRSVLNGDILTVSDGQFTISLD